MPVANRSFLVPRIKRASRYDFTIQGSCFDHPTDKSPLPRALNVRIAMLFGSSLRKSRAGVTLQPQTDGQHVEEQTCARVPLMLANFMNLTKPNMFFVNLGRSLTVTKQILDDFDEKGFALIRTL